MSDPPLDGNAAAGVLAELFLQDMTTAVTTCAGCGAVCAIGDLGAYLQAPGLVLRCRSCGVVQVRVVRAPGRAWLDLRGVRVRPGGDACLTPPAQGDRPPARPQTARTRAGAGRPLLSAGLLTCRMRQCWCGQAHDGAS